MESTYAKIIKEICLEEGFELSCFSADWIFVIKKEGKSRNILAFQFDLNTAAVQAICKDKCAASDVLSHYGIPCVEHLFFTNPLSGYLPKSGNYKYLHELLAKHQKLVCKPNAGASGTNVFPVADSGELERAMAKIFKSADSMAVSPYHEIEKEFRLIVLDGKVKLAFSKEIPFVKGDGRSTLAELMSKSGIAALPADMGDISLSTVLEVDEIWKYGWKHNLAHGAVPQVVNDEALISELSKLALRASEALNIKFASIDIIRSADSYKILEINGGVMMEHFASASPENYTKAKAIYKEAIYLMFA